MICASSGNTPYLLDMKGSLGYMKDMAFTKEGHITAYLLMIYSHDTNVIVILLSP